MTINKNKVLGKSGFRIQPSINRVAQEKINQLANFPVAVIGDGLGRRAIMDAQIKPLSAKMRLFGNAITVETRPGDNLMIHAALKVAQKGDVIVVNAHGFREAAVWGMLMANSAMQLGIAGIVIDGAVRDCQEIAESGLATFSRWVCPAGPHKDGPGQVNFPISCGGVAIMPGDVIIGDADGVIVVPADDIDMAIDLAQKKTASEEKRLDEIINQNIPHQSWLVPTLREKGVLKEGEEI